MREREISVDINGGAFRLLKYKQYDHNNLLKIIIKENNKVVALKGYTARAFFELPSKTILQKNCNIVDNKIQILLTKDILFEKGEISAEITLSDGDKVVTTFRIYLEVEDSIDRNSAIEGNPEWDIIADGLGALDATNARVTTVEDRTSAVENRTTNVENDIEKTNKELDKIKKLEESTVSTVETERDFTTVEATSNGYFEDVKLEGKTLATVLTCSTNKNYAKWSPVDCVSYKAVEVGKVYTIIAQTNNTAQCGLKNRTSSDYLLALAAANEFICKTITFSKAEELVIVTDTEGTVNMELMIVEGDHTQNPPSYFEGLKSVGDVVDEIVVSSVKGDGNLFDKKNIHLNKFLQANGDETSIEGWFVSDYIKVADTCYIKGLINVASSNLARICVYTQNKTFKALLSQPLNTTLNISSFIENGDYIRITEKIEQVDNIVVCKNEISNQIYQSDKKRLLYYDDETQTWEKPILREWDSIEKHANGKYYYHQRSGEVVLNGSEYWRLQSDTAWETDTHISFYYQITDMKLNLWGSESVSICDRFNTITANNSNYTESNEFSSTDFQKFNIKILKSKLSTQDLEGLKQWLQANNVTVVYQLAQEKVYECTNIDLITYNGETNYVVESGAIVPKTTLKLQQNIMNVVRVLQEKVSILETTYAKVMQMLSDIINK